MNLKRLFRWARSAKDYQEFERRVIAFLRWYDVPKTWTKKDLENFYTQNGGR